MVRRVRPARHYQHPRAPVRLLADDSIPGLARAFKTSLKAARRLFDSAKAEYLLFNGRYREVFGIIDWKHADEAMRRPLAMVADTWLAAGEIGERKLNGAFANRGRKVRYATIRKDRADQFSYDRYDPGTQGRIREVQNALIRQLGADSRATIEAVILRAMREGKPPSETVREIKAVIGLTERQAQAVLRYKAQLEALDAGALSRALVGAKDRSLIGAAIGDGKGLSAPLIDQLVASYEDAYLTYRATTIATTEATRAATMGLQDSYMQAVERGVLPAEAVTQHWQISLDEKTCDHCLSVIDMNPDGVGLGESFQSDEGPVDGPGLHPNCRCSVELVTDLDLVPSNYDG